MTLAKCSTCNREMLTAKGCKYSTIGIKGKAYRRIKVGDPMDFFYGDPKGSRCGDCGAQVGYFHHWGCDCERCPLCGEQLISCDCDGVYLIRGKED